MWPIKRRETPGSEATSLATLTRGRPVDPVADYKQWVARASALADARASQVTDPLSNPDTVGHLRDRARALSVTEIDAQHDERAHALAVAARHRRVEVEAAETEIAYRLDERDRAADRIRRIEDARAAHDPATAAADLARITTTRVRRYLVISWLMSGLAAVGIGASVTLAGWPLPMAIAVGVAAEAGLSYLVASIISDQAEARRRVGLARTADRTRIDVDLPRWVRVLPWAGVVGLLTVSVGVNTFGLIMGTGELGLLGVIGACVAALAVLLAWAYSAQTSAIVTSLLADAGIQAGADELAAVASGERIPTYTTPAAPQAVTVDREAVLEALASDPGLMDAVLSEATDRAITQMPPPSSTAIAGVEDEGAGAVATMDRPSQAGLAEGTAASAGTGAANRALVRSLREEIIRETGEEPSKSELARRTGLDRRTVGRHLSD